ncbi:MAG TPA: hypothetical protein DCO75_00155, partial [Fibrobacteres bacterium]|nr:hypothetical protein [Fibrobacterota bacterium]
ADTACDNENWPAAHCFLENAVLLTKKMEISAGDVSLCDEYFKEIASIYYDRMPDDYSDSLPDEISLVTFRKQLAESIESGSISADDSIMFQKMVNIEKSTCNIPVVWNERVYKALYFLNRGGKGPIDKWIARADYYLPGVKKMFSD